MLSSSWCRPSRDGRVSNEMSMLYVGCCSKHIRVWKVCVEDKRHYQICQSKQVDTSCVLGFRTLSSETNTLRIDGNLNSFPMKINIQYGIYWSSYWSFSWWIDTNMLCYRCNRVPYCIGTMLLCNPPFHLPYQFDEQTPRGAGKTFTCMSYNVLLPNSTLYFVRCWLWKLKLPRISMFPEV